MSKKNPLYGATRCALMAVLAFIPGIIVLTGGKVGGGVVLMVCSAFFAVVAVVQWRRGLL